MQNSKDPYLDLLFTNDSLNKETLAAVIKQTAGSVNDIDKENYLKRISPEQRKDLLISAAYLDITNALMQIFKR